MAVSITILRHPVHRAGRKLGRQVIFVCRVRAVKAAERHQLRASGQRPVKGDLSASSYAARVDDIFDRIDAGLLQGFTSLITLVAVSQRLGPQQTRVRAITW